MFYFAAMALFITSINSGSNGNCYYVGNKNEAILVDAGISCRTIERRLKALNLNVLLIRGIFISHEHTDHIKGVETLSKKYNIPVYVSERTYDSSGLNIAANLLAHFGDQEEIRVGGLTVHAFTKIHDAADPFSFCVSYNSVQVGIFTDIGYCCDNIIQWFKRCHAAFLESNYDEDMLANGPYPYFLKRRISDGRGHLSNAIAHRLFCEHRADFMSHLILSHLSEKNNTPDIVEELFRSNCGDVKIVVASRSEATRVFEICNSRRPARTRVDYKQAVLPFG